MILNCAAKKHYNCRLLEDRLNDFAVKHTNVLHGRKASLWPSKSHKLYFQIQLFVWCNVKKKSSFLTRVICRLQTESWLFHFGLLKLKSKHSVLASSAEVFYFKSLKRSFAFGPGTSQLLHKVRCTTPECFADCTPHPLWDLWFHIFPHGIFCGKQMSS